MLVLAMVAGAPSHSIAEGGETALAVAETHLANVVPSDAMTVRIDGAYYARRW